MYNITCTLLIIAAMSGIPAGVKVKGTPLQLTIHVPPDFEGKVNIHMPVQLDIRRAGPPNGPRDEPRVPPPDRVPPDWVRVPPYGPDGPRIPRHPPESEESSEVEVVQENAVAAAAKAESATTPILPSESHGVAPTVSESHGLISRDADGEANPKRMRSSASQRDSLVTQTMRGLHDTAPPTQGSPGLEDAAAHLAAQMSDLFEDGMFEDGTQPDSLGHR